jgi:deazaflavin-dependent oxidoreductase (nitroreductase family)
MDARTAQRLAKISSLQTLVLTHYGRKSGKPYDVVIWFVVDGERMFLATANKNRNWVRNVLVKPHVVIKAGGETFSATLTEITDGGERERARRLVQAKYWYAMPIIVTARVLQGIGLLKDVSSGFEVKFDAVTE